MASFSGNTVFQNFFSLTLVAGTQYQLWVNPKTVFNQNGSLQPVLESSRLTIFGPDGATIGTYGDGLVGTNADGIYPHMAAVFFIPTVSGGYTFSPSPGISARNFGNFTFETQLLGPDTDASNGNAVLVRGNYSSGIASISGTTVVVHDPSSAFKQPQIVSNASRVEFADGTLVVTPTTSQFLPGVFTLSDTIVDNTPHATIFGTANNDIITALGGDVTVTGGQGNDTITAGPGTNESVYSGLAKNYKVSIVAGGGAIGVQDKVGGDGADTLTGIQTLRFSDQVFDAATLSKAAMLSAAQFASLAELYIASFSRAPDAVGLDYWASQMKDGMSLQAIAKSFFVQPEAAAFYPAGQSTQAFITSVYNNVLNRGPDSGGLAYWAGELQSGNISKDSFLLAIINGAHSGGTDTQVLLNKTAVGEHFALTQGLSNGTWARTVMGNVTGSASSVTTANNLTDGFAITAASAGSSEMVIQILGIAA